MAYKPALVEESSIVAQQKFADILMILKTFGLPAFDVGFCKHSSFIEYRHSYRSRFCRIEWCMMRDREGGWSVGLDIQILDEHFEAVAYGMVFCEPCDDGFAWNVHQEDLEQAEHGKWLLELLPDGELEIGEQDAHAIIAEIVQYFVATCWQTSDTALVPN